MISFSTGMYREWRNTRTRWVVLGLAIALALTGAWDVVLSSSNRDASALRKTTVSPQDALALPPAPGDRVLIGTILAAKLADIRTVIADVRGHQRLYARGDEIPGGGAVVEIHRDYVVVRRDGRLETLEFQWNALAAALERAAGLARGAAQETPPSEYLEVLRGEMLAHPELLFELIGAAPVVEGGRFLGYRVMKSEDSVTLEYLGLEPGDILVAVNSVPLNTPDYGVQLFDAMSGTGKLTFTVRRGAQVLVLHD